MEQNNKDDQVNDQIEKAKFIRVLLKPDAKLEGMQSALIPRIKAKYDEMEQSHKRLAEMIEEATQVKSALDADRGTIAELEGVLWDECKRNQLEAKKAKKTKKKDGGTK